MILKAIDAKVNGLGWLVGLIVNLVALTLAVSTLYWKLHEDIAVIRAQNEVSRQRIVEVRMELIDFTLKADRTHERIWDRIGAAK